MNTLKISSNQVTAKVTNIDTSYNSRAGIWCTTASIVVYETGAIANGYLINSSVVGFGVEAKHAKSAMIKEVYSLLETAHQELEHRKAFTASIVNYTE